ncbi:MAG TPA: PKD domain-containing protein [Pyrinomonadaceae bacterium]|jgi:hypothetical protein
MNFFKGLLAAVLFALATAATHAPQSPTSLGVQRNRPPAVKLTLAADSLILAGGCSEDERPNPMCPATSPKVRLSAAASDPDGDRLLYTYLTTGGTLSGDGPDTTLDVTGVAPGVYAVTVEVNDGRGGKASDTASITLARCSCPAPVPSPPQCPTVVVSCPDDTLDPSRPKTFTAEVSGGDPNVTPTFKWTVSGGAISDGQGTNSITVDTTGVASSTTTTATVDVGGYDRSCQTSASCTRNIVCPLPARKIDEYGRIPFGDEKARLNNMREELQNDPTAQGYLICYGGRRGRAGEARRLCERARDYLVATRGIEGSRVVTVEGGLREEPTTEFWIVPSGATPPTPTPTVGRR